MTNLADATQATMALVERHAAHTIRRCLWRRPALRVRGSPISTACATWTGYCVLAVNPPSQPREHRHAHAQVDTVTLLNRGLHADRRPLRARSPTAAVRALRTEQQSVTRSPAEPTYIDDKQLHQMSPMTRCGSGVEPYPDSARYRLAMLRYRADNRRQHCR